MNNYLKFNLEKQMLLWGNLKQGVLIKRYKRFLADVKLENGEIITAHTANTGRMTGCSSPGRPVWLSLHENKNRKYPHSWEIIEMPNSLVGINTNVPNKLIKALCQHSLIAELNEQYEVLSEVKYNNSRLDLKLNPAKGPSIYIEIKNSTLAENRIAKFPDAETKRGQKHLDNLTEIVKSGQRALIFILAQRSDVDYFSPAYEIDPIWGEKLQTALKAGVEFLAYQANVSPEGVVLGNKLKLII